MEYRPELRPRALASEVSKYRAELWLRIMLSEVAISRRRATARPGYGGRLDTGRRVLFVEGPGTGRGHI